MGDPARELHPQSARLVHMCGIHVSDHPRKGVNIVLSDGFTVVGGAAQLQLIIGKAVQQGIPHDHAFSVNHAHGFKHPSLLKIGAAPYQRPPT